MGIRIPAVAMAVLLPVSVAAAQDGDPVRALERAHRSSVRETAVERLREAGPKMYARVVPILKSKSDANRRAAAMLLDEFARKLGKPPGSPKALVRALKDRDPVTRAHLVSALSRYGSNAAAPLLKMLKQRREFIRHAAARALAAQGPPVVPKLVAMLADENPRAQVGAMHALGWFDDPGPKAFARMKKGIAAAGDEERAAAAFGMRGCKAQRAQALPLLKKALRDKIPGVSAAAANAAANHGDEGITVLVDSLGTGTPALEVAIEQGLVAQGDKVIEILALAMTEGTPPHRAAAARVLGGVGRTHGYSSVAKALAEGLKDKDPGVRTESARALRWLALDAARLATDALMKAAQDEHAGARAAVLLALARVATKRSQIEAPADRALKHHDPQLQAVGAYLLFRLRKMPAKRAIPIVHLCIADPNLDASVRADGLLMMAELPGGAKAMLGLASEIFQDKAQPERLRSLALDALRTAIVTRSAGLPDRTGAYANSSRARPAADRALKWLADRQSREDGRWSSRAMGAPHDFDVGVTGMVVLAFLGAGRTDGPVKAGLEYLAATQTKDGEFNPYSNRSWTRMCQHAWATLAVCEAAELVDGRKWRPVAQAAVRFCEKARNPHAAWKYEIRGGENDTHITALMVQALRVAAHVGLEVDRGAWEGARQWIDKMTEPNFGQAGYDRPGGYPFRTTERKQADRFPPDKTQSMTAAAILIRTMLGEDPRKSEMCKKGARLCLIVPPVWNKDDGSIDMYYWHFASLAMFQNGGADFRTWWDAMVPVLVDNQEADGSWAPVGAWGSFGGRGYSTAIGALTLLAPNRYPRWRETTAMPKEMGKIYDEIREAARKDRSPLIRETASRVAHAIEKTMR